MTGCPSNPCPYEPDPGRYPPERPDPKCRCNTPFLRVVRPGEHFHPCPAHPWVVIVGTGPTL